jgi:hypothetical protein
MPTFGAVRVGGRRGLGAPSWFAAILLGLGCIWLGYDAFANVSALEGRAGYQLNNRRKARWNVSYLAAVRHGESLGRWGCGALFAVPGAIAVGCGVWDLGRRRRAPR